MKQGKREARALYAAAAVVALALFVLPFFAHASSEDEQRARVGVTLFRAMLAADLDIDKKKNSEGALVVLFAYDGEAGRAGRLAALFTGREGGKERAIRGALLDVLLHSVDEPNPPSSTIAAIYIAEKLDEERMTRMVSQAQRLGVILFSPFQGDVQRGASGGLSITAQVRPFVNISSLNKAEIRLKPFFMNVALTHE